MEKIELEVVALHHWDYKERIDELLDTAVGKRMYISVEQDNQYQRNAVPVHFGTSHVGYIRKGKDRLLAYQAIMQSGKKTLRGVVTGISRERTSLFLTVEADVEVDPDFDDRNHEFLGWSFDGKVLPQCKTLCTLHTMIDALEDAFDSGAEWGEELESMLRFLEEHYYLDISSETQTQLTNLVRAMQGRGDGVWQTVGNRIEVMLRHLTYDDVIERKVAELESLAASPEMDELMRYYGDEANKILDYIPKSFIAVFETNRRKAIAQLWYMNLSAVQAQALKTLLAMKIRLEDIEKEEDETLKAIMEYVMRASPSWKGTRDQYQKFWDDFLHITINAETKEQLIEQYRKNIRNEKFNKVLCQMHIGVLVFLNYYYDSYTGIAQLLEPSQSPNGNCAHTMRRGKNDENFIAKMQEDGHAVLQKWKS